MSLLIINHFFCMNYRIGTANQFLSDININITIYRDDDNICKVFYRTLDNIKSLSLENFCQKINYYIKQIDFNSSTSLNKLQNYINKEIDMQILFPLCA